MSLMRMGVEMDQSKVGASNQNNQGSSTDRAFYQMVQNGGRLLSGTLRHNILTIMAALEDWRHLL